MQNMDAQDDVPTTKPADDSTVATQEQPAEAPNDEVAMKHRPFIHWNQLLKLPLLHKAHPPWLPFYRKMSF